MAQSLFTRLFTSEPIKQLLSDLKTQLEVTSNEVLLNILQLCVDLTGFQYELSAKDAGNSTTYVKTIQAAIDGRAFLTNRFLLQETNAHLMDNVQTFFFGAIVLLEIDFLERLNDFLLAMILSNQDEFKIVGSFLRVVFLHGFTKKLNALEKEIVKIEAEMRQRRINDPEDEFMEQLDELMQEKMAECIYVNRLIDKSATHFDIGLMYSDSSVPIVECFCDLLERHFEYFISPDRNFLKQFLAIFSRKDKKCLMMAVKSLQKLVQIDEEESRTLVIDFCLREGNRDLYSLLFVDQQQRQLVIVTFKLVNLVQTQLGQEELVFEWAKTKKLYLKIFSESRVMRELMAEFIQKTALMTPLKDPLGVVVYLLTKFDVPKETMRQTIDLIMPCPSFTQWENYVELLKESNECPIKCSVIVDLLCVVLGKFYRQNGASDELIAFTKSLADFLRELRDHPVAYKCLLNVFLTLHAKLFLSPPTGDEKVFRAIIREIYEALPDTRDFFTVKKMAFCLFQFKQVSADVQVVLEERLNRAFEAFMDEEGYDERHETASIELAVSLSYFNEDTLNDEQLGSILSRVEPSVVALEGDKVIYLTIAGYAAYHQLTFNLRRFNSTRLFECYTQNLNIAEHLIAFLREMKQDEAKFDKEAAHWIFNTLCILAETFSAKVLLRADIRLPADIFHVILIRMSEFIAFTLHKPNSDGFLKLFTKLFNNPDIIPRLDCVHPLLKQLGHNSDYARPLGVFLETLLQCAERKHGNAKVLCAVLAHALIVLDRQKPTARVEAFVAAVLPALNVRAAPLFGPMVVETVRGLVEEMEPANSNNRLQLLDGIRPIAQKAAGNFFVVEEAEGFLRRASQKWTQAEKKSLKAFLAVLKGRTGDASGDVSGDASGDAGEENNESGRQSSDESEVPTQQRSSV